MCYFLMAIPFNLPTDEETEDNYRRLDQLLADLYDVLRQILLRPRLHQPPQRVVRDAARQQNEVAAGGTDPDPPDRGSDDRSLLGLPDLVLSAVPSADDACAPPSPTLSSPPSTTTASSSTVHHRLPPRHPSTRRRTRRRRVVSCGGSKTPRCSRLPEAETPARSLTSPTSAQSTVKFSCEFNRVSALSTENWALVGHQLRKIAEDFRASHRKEESTTRTEQKLQVEVKTSSLFSLLVPAPFGGSIWTTVILIVGWRLLMGQR